MPGIEAQRSSKLTHGIWLSELDQPHQEAIIVGLQQARLCRTSRPEPLPTLLQVTLVSSFNRHPFKLFAALRLSGLRVVRSSSHHTAPSLWVDVFRSGGVIPGNLLGRALLDCGKALSTQPAASADICPPRLCP